MYYILAKGVNAVVPHFVVHVITTLCPVTTNRVEANSVVTLFIVTEKNVVITTNGVAMHRHL